MERKKKDSVENRHVFKNTTGKKKYYYSVFTTGLGSNEAKGPIVEITMKSGSKYKGEINEKNEREGFGVYEVINGGTYAGNWFKGFKHGFGEFTNRDNIVEYSGQWEYGEPHGEGKLFNRYGKLVYEGEFLKGKVKGGKFWSDYKNSK